MRHRERVTASVSDHVETETWRYDYRFDPIVYAYSKYRDTDIVVLETREEMDDVVTPRWNKLLSSGGIANNPMKKVTTWITDEVTSCYIASSRSVRSGTEEPYEWGEVSLYEAVGTLSSREICEARGGFLPTPTYDQQDYRDLALTKAWSNVRLDKVQALVMLGESKKTVLSMITMFGRLIKILKSIKRLDARALRREVTGKELADRYMELRYAIRPLIYDFNGTIAALKHEAGEIGDRLTFRGHEFYTHTDTDGDTYFNGTTVNGGVRSYDFERQTKVSCDVRSGVLTQLETVSQLPVWGLLQPIEAAWELVPFSFIVDWFVNAGNTIAAFTPDFGLKTLASWTVSTEKVEKWFRITDSSAVPGEDTETYTCDWSRNDFSNCFCSETIITTERVPDPSRSIIPTMKVNLDCFKLIDLLIIVKQLTSK